MAVFAWGGFFYGNAFYMVALSDTHGWSVSQISSAITLGFFSCIPASIAVGWMFDLHGRRWGALAVVGYGAIAMGLGIACLGRIDTTWQLYAVYMLMGSAYPALAAPAISAALHQRVHQRYGLALGLALTGASVGGAIAAPLLLWGTQRFGFAVTQTALGCLVPLVLIPLAGWVLRPTLQRTPQDSAALEARASASLAHADQAAQRTALSVALRGGHFRKIFIVGLLSLVAQVGFLAHQLSVLSAELASTTAAFAVGATAVASAVGRLLIGVLSSWVPLRHLAALTYSVMAVGIMLVAFGDSPSVLIAGSLVSGLFVGAVVLLPPMLCRLHFNPEIYARIYGFVAVGVYAGGGLGPSLAGFGRDAFGQAWPALACLAAISVTAAVIVETLHDR